MQSLLGIFVESSLGDKKQDTQTAVKFLDDQIKRYEELLLAAENRLKEFKLKYLGVADREGPDYFGRIAKLQTAIADARTGRAVGGAGAGFIQARSCRASRRALCSTCSESTDPTRPCLKSTRGSAACEGVLDDVRRRYTDQHPDVQIDGSTDRPARGAEEGAVGRAPKGGSRRRGGPATFAPIDRNPVFQQLKISLADAEATLASARAKLAGYEAQYKALKAQAQIVPQIEAEFAQLNRDYDVQKKTYESLLARRESAAMGKDVQDSGGARFRVIDPPRVSPEPVAPRRIWLLVGALLASLASDVAASFFASQVMPIFHDAVRCARWRSVRSSAWYRCCRAIAGCGCGVGTPIFLPAASAA